VELKYSEFWSRTKAYERLKKLRSGEKEFYFVDGPPYVSGPVHMGTARNKVVKDAVLRFKRMGGLNVRDQPGYDMHGLPVELQVEKAMGLSSKRQIETLGVDLFIDRCREFADETQREMSKQFKDLGVWMDWDAPYLTSSNEYIESAWWTLKKAYTNETLVREERVVPWCPRCETALSSTEVTYSTELTPSVYLKLPIRGKRDEYLLVWTTNPWTLTANMALAVNPDYSYARVKIRKGGKVESVVMLEENVEEVATQTGVDAYEITETVSGDKLVGLAYFNPLMADIPYQKEVKGEWVHKVLPSSGVTREHTGVVHVAPGLGTADYEIGMANKLPLYSPVDSRGTFTTESGLKYAGKAISDASKQVVADLSTMKFVLHADQEEGRVGHCWRCRSSVVHRASKQWVLKVSTIKEKMLRGIKAATWAPGYMGSSRMYSFIEKTDDWCVSRQRFWGIPLPVWECITDLCAHVEFVGGIKELKGKPGYKEGMDLHRPAIDDVRLECPKCGGAMKRVPDVMDVWFDSSIATWAQLRYPQKRDEFKRWWPCDWVSEAHDQVKGWFYTQICSSMLVFDRMPYKSALVHGWILDQGGKQMSKTNDNCVSPSEVVKEYGRDATRLYLLKRAAPWDDVNFNADDVRIAGKFINTLWNCYVFAATYMSIDAFDPTRKRDVGKGLAPEDRWLASRLDRLKAQVTAEMQTQNLNKAAQAIESFIVQDLSHWYVKLVRDRAWTEGKKEDKEALYQTLSDALVTTAQLLAPFAPYVAEEIYQNFDGRLVSIHLCDWPVADKERIDDGLEKQMAVTREVVDAANQARQSVGYKLRWPVKKITIEAKEEEVFEAVKAFEHIVKRQANTSAIEIVPVGQEWSDLEIQVHPNPNVIGKAYKMWEKKIARMLEIRPAKKIKEDIDKGVYKLGIEGQLIDILPEMVTFTSKLPDNVVSGQIVNGNVYVNVTVDDDVMSEGYTRDVIRRIQEMRRELQMDIEDYVRVTLSAPDDVQPLLERWEDRILQEARCNELAFAVEVDEEYIVEWTIGESPVTIGVTPIRMKATVDQFTTIPGVEKNLAIALFAAGYQAPVDVATAAREDVLKVPGMNHATLRRITEWFELPDQLKGTEEVRCPVCQKLIEEGGIECPRCGERLIAGEASETDLTDALEQTLVTGEDAEAEEGDEIEKVKGRASKLLEVIEDLRKPGVAEDASATSPEELLPKRAPPRKQVAESTEPVEEFEGEVLVRREREEAPTSKAPAREREADVERERPDTPRRAAREEVPPRKAPAREPEIDAELEGLEISKVMTEEAPVRKGHAREPEIEVEREGLETPRVTGEEAPARKARAREPGLEVAREELDSIRRAAREEAPKRAAREEEPEVERVREEPKTLEETHEEVPAVTAPSEEPEVVVEPEGPEAPEAVREASERELEAEISTMEEPKRADIVESKLAVKTSTDSEADDEEGAEEEGSEEDEAMDKKAFIRKVAETASVTPAVARSLWKAGYTSVEKVGEASEDDLRNVDKVGKVTARKLLEAFSKRTPVETQMCSLCNAIVPIEAKRCPRCGTVFESEAHAEEETRLIEKQLKTVEALDKRLETKPEDPDLLYSKAMTVYEMGDRAEAMRLLKEALSIKPDHERAMAAYEGLAGEAIKPGEAPEPARAEAPAEEARPQVEEMPPSMEGEAPSQPRAEEEMPQEVMTTLQADRGIDLRESCTYLFREERSSRAYEIFRRYVEGGKRGFCVTRNYPDKVRDTYKLGETPILWLSNVGTKDAVRPKDLEKLSLSLEQFLGRQGGIVLLDGLEYLITNNNFITVLRLIQSLRDQVAINRSILIMPVNPSTMSVNELNNLEKEVDVVLS
jgi:isoleucyl-tRNA synthetase